MNKTPTTAKHIVYILIFCTSTEHVFNVSAVLSHYQLHTMTPFIDALVTTEYRLFMKIISPNISDGNEKLTNDQKSLVKQQILMYKTTVYRLVKRRHYTSKKQMSQTGDIPWQYIDT